jgi:hypothetical protein
MVGFSYLMFSQFFTFPDKVTETNKDGPEYRGIKIDNVEENLVYVRNTGTRDIVTSQIKVFVDGQPVGCEFGIYSIKPNEVRTCNLATICRLGSLLRVTSNLDSATITCLQQSVSTTQPVTGPTTVGVTTIFEIYKPANLREIQQCMENGNVAINFHWDYQGSADYFELLAYESMNFPGSARESGLIFNFPANEELEWELTVFAGNKIEGGVKTFRTIQC